MILVAFAHSELPPQVGSSPFTAEAPLVSTNSTPESDTRLTILPAVRFVFVVQDIGFIDKDREDGKGSYTIEREDEGDLHTETILFNPNAKPNDEDEIEPYEASLARAKKIAEANHKALLDSLRELNKDKKDQPIYIKEFKEKDATVPIQLPAHFH